MSQYMIDMLRAQTIILNKVTEFQKKVQLKHIERKKLELQKRRHIEHKFVAGDFVLVEYHKDGNNPGRGVNKLSFREKGPYKVISHDIDIIKVQNLIDDKFEYFHISLVSPYRFDSNGILPADVAKKSGSEVEYIVGEILDHLPKDINSRTYKDQIFFKVRWQNYSEKYDTWEPWSNVRLVEKVHKYLMRIGMKSLIPSGCKEVEDCIEKEVQSRKHGRQKKRKNLDTGNWELSPISDII
jgi:hypothetical protein